MEKHRPLSKYSVFIWEKLWNPASQVTSLKWLPTKRFSPKWQWVPSRMMHTAALQKLLRNSLRSVTRPLSLNLVLWLLVHATPPHLCLVWFGVPSLQSPVIHAPTWSLTARVIDRDNIDISIGFGIGSILMGWDWYFSSSSPFSSRQLGPTWSLVLTLSWFGVDDLALLDTLSSQVLRHFILVWNSVESEPSIFAFLT